jgi:hypothetical protein
MYAINLTQTDSVDRALLFLKKNEKFNYIAKKNSILNLLEFFKKMHSVGRLEHWEIDSENAEILCEYIRNTDM